MHHSPWAQGEYARQKEGLVRDDACKYGLGSAKKLPWVHTGKEQVGPCHCGGHRQVPGATQLPPFKQGPPV